MFTIIYILYVAMIIGCAIMIGLLINQVKTDREIRAFVEEHVTAEARARACVIAEEAVMRKARN